MIYYDIDKCIQYPQRYFLQNKNNNRKGFTHDGIELTPDRTVYMHDRIGL